jgi:transcriptional regulator with XRE-family HTH domain
MASSLTDITPKQALGQLEAQLGISRSDLASALGVSLRTIERWRAGTAYPQHEARACLEALLELSDTLHGMFDSPDAARTWFQAENRYLGFLSPADAVRAGRIDRARAALEALESGIFT